MYCPGCASPVVDDTKFCKSCGTNLRGVRDAMTGRSEQFDWSKTWVAEMFLTEEERERRHGITPEQKRLNEIKAGVITTLTGLGAMIFFYFFLGTVADAKPQDESVEIIRRVWLLGLVPFLIGLGILFNGIFLTKRQIAMNPPSVPPALPTPSTNQLIEPAGTQASVTEHTTAHLPQRREAIYAPLREDEH